MKIKIMHPLISCLCLIEDNSNSLLKAILCFDWQNYPNRELIISFSNRDQKIRTLMNTENIRKNPAIKMIERPNDMSANMAWDIAVKNCQGEYICIWDIDALHDINRLSTQYNCMQGPKTFYKASLLRRIILNDQITRQNYISPSRVWTPTLLCKKEYFESFSKSSPGSSVLEDIVDKLANMGLLKQVDDQPLLYVYRQGEDTKLSSANFKFLLRMSENILQPYLQNLHLYFHHQYHLLLQ